LDKGRVLFDSKVVIILLDKDLISPHSVTLVNSPTGKAYEESCKKQPAGSSASVKADDRRLYGRSTHGLYKESYGDKHDVDNVNAPLLQFTCLAVFKDLVSLLLFNHFRTVFLLVDSWKLSNFRD